MLTHDIINIKYVNLGYLKKNYPYHLISDEEMFNAFIDLGTGFTSSLIDPNVRFFDAYYSNPFSPEDEYKKVNSAGEVIEVINMYQEYNKLKDYIIASINEYLALKDLQSSISLPDWIYTYMLGEVVYKQSEYLDIQDTLTLLGCYNIDNDFNKLACVNCYSTSLKYISTLKTGLRPPTVFGEPHVIKQLRLEN